MKLGVFKATKKPVTIEAIQYNGLNFNAINEFMHNCKAKVVDRRIRIPTLEGHIYASEGDFIIKGVEDEFYPCAPDIFKKTYDY